jgi:predicted TIM-barrel fold metal-dependent hydrolase
MDEILIKDYAPRSSVITDETFIPRAKYPAIDSHVHVEAKTPEELREWVDTMDEVGIEKSVILTGVNGEEFNALAALYTDNYPDRFVLFCGIDKTGIDRPDYSERAVTELERCCQKGARGVGEISDKGYGITGDAALAQEKRLHPDDVRLDEVWQKCAELKMPVSLHVADHPSCWTPLDVYQERSPDYQHFNKYGKNVSSHQQLITIRNLTLSKHPDTIFVACHLGNQGHDLPGLSRDMDQYPNLYVDTSARDYELGRTPRAASKFLQKYRDRVVFGTDQGRKDGMYRMHWRLLESADEYMVGRVGWRYYGLALKESTLEAIYRNTASQILEA